MSLTTITTATPAAVIDPPGIASHEFRRVRKGYDPDEVRLYLDLLARNWQEVPPAAQGDDTRAPAVLAQAQAQADQLLRDAHREVEELKREHAAMQAWFGGAEHAGAPQVGGDPDAAIQAAVAHADDIIRSAQAQADAMIAKAAAEAEARRSAGTDGGLGGLGAHVERIVQQAEAEGRVLISDATAQAERLRAEAEADRAEAAATLSQAQHDADALVADARSASEAVRAAAVPAATAHVEDVLRRGRLELEVVQAEIDDTRARLVDIHQQLARSLGHPAPPAVLADAVVFVPPSEPHADATWDSNASREIIVGRAEPSGASAVDPAIGELDISPW